VSPGESGGLPRVPDHQGRPERGPEPGILPGLSGCFAASGTGCSSAIVAEREPCMDCIEGLSTAQTGSGRPVVSRELGM
jgi:hypothetical protein